MREDEARQMGVDVEIALTLASGRVRGAVITVTKQGCGWCLGNRRARFESAAGWRIRE